MKRITNIILSSLLIAACSELAEVLQQEADFASVKLSSSSAVISEEGGSKSIFVAANREEWEAVCDQDWVDISIDDNAVTFYVDENTDSENRIAVVDVIAGEKPDVAKARFKVLQKKENQKDH